MHPVFAWLPHGADWIYILGFFLLVGLGGTILWIAALLSCLKNESATDNTKVVWALVIALTHCLGAALYFLVRRPQRIRELGR
jgi:TRAP-type C4-dicarboxylate transport system permease small subunit